MNYRTSSAIKEITAYHTIDFVVLILSIYGYNKHYHIIMPSAHFKNNNQTAML